MRHLMNIFILLWNRSPYDAAMRSLPRGTLNRINHLLHRVFWIHNHHNQNPTGVRETAAD